MGAVSDLGTILTAIVTPFDEQLRVDEEAFVALMHHLAAHGSDGFVVTGTTGEASTLTDDEQLRLIELAVRERPTLPGGRGGRCTIVAGTGTNDTRHAVFLTEQATALGVDANLSVTPYYNRPSPRGLIAHYEAIAKATDKPIMLYNIPSRTGTNIGPELLARLAEIEHVEAVKQANAQELRQIEGLALYAGDDATFARTLDIGGAGVVSVASHVVGDDLRRMVDEPGRRAEIDESLRDVYATLFMTASPTCTKAALNMLGHRAGGLRLPLVEAEESEREAVREMLIRHGLLTADGTPTEEDRSPGAPGGGGATGGATAADQQASAQRA